MPCPSVARKRLDGEICSWLACWGQNTSRVAAALYSYYYTSGSKNKRDHLYEIEILVEIQEIGDTASLVIRLLAPLGQSMCPHCLTCELQPCDVDGLRIRNDVQCRVAGGYTSQALLKHTRGRRKMPSLRSVARGESRHPILSFGESSPAVCLFSTCSFCVSGSVGDEDADEWLNRRRIVHTGNSGVTLNWSGCPAVAKSECVRFAFQLVAWRYR